MTPFYKVDITLLFLDFFFTCTWHQS